MNVLSLFSGIEGLGLGLERAGMTIVGQVEIDPYCRRVNEKNYPGVPKHDDVRTAGQWWRSQKRPHVDLIAGGFPCQPVGEAPHGRHIATQGVDEARPASRPRSGHWASEPGVGRLVDGPPHELALRALGNSVVPQMAEHVGRMIMEAAA